MKIGVVFTGGTIGSAVNDNGYIATKKDTAYLLLEQYRNKCNQSGEKAEITFLTKTPYHILSENLSGRELEQLILCINALLNEKDLDGIIVTHGTDTLQYTAAVLGYVFCRARLPIVLVSSNYVLDDARANGLSNFYYGVEFIKGGYGKGVFVSYCNNDKIPRIHYGTRLNMPVFYSDEVFSIEDGEYGHFTTLCGHPEFCQADGNIRECRDVATNKTLFDNIEKNPVRLSDCNDTILQIHPFVGMKYPPLASSTKIILHGSFHSGTIAVTEDLRSFAQEAEKLGIPFYLIGLSSGTIHYETVQFYNRCHMIPLYDTAFIAQYCKAWLAISNRLPLKIIMEQCIAEDWVCAKCIKRG